MDRRDFLIKSAVLGCSGAACTVRVSGSAQAAAREPEAGRALPIPEVMTPGGGAAGRLDAIQGTVEFLAGVGTRTQGFNQSFLGPLVRVQRGQTVKMAVTNRTDAPITAHWHGLHVGGAVDGGPQLVFGPGKTWSPELEIDQPASTLWYHSHVHGRTADQVYSGLAGMIIVDDPGAPDSGLPQSYGVDDIPLIVQDRAFDQHGQFLYINRGPARMLGFRADQVLVNGAVRPVTSVPQGMVRLRLLNASNARIYTFSFDDEREFHQVGTDGGLLPRPLSKTTLMLAPAERAEIVVDFSNGRAVRLLSSPDTNVPSMAAGMMARMMGGTLESPTPVLDDGRFEIMSFGVDASHPAAVTRLPNELAGSPTRPDWGEAQIEREFRLDMHAGGAGMGGMMGRDGGMVMGINGQSMDMDVINVEARIGDTELWRVRSSEMAHPFHLHGTSFQVISHNGKLLPYEETGLKDVFLVQGEAELLVKHSREADARAPFMYHCHILEHEDAGMMGQLTVA